MGRGGSPTVSVTSGRTVEGSCHGGSDDPPTGSMGGVLAINECRDSKTRDREVSGFGLIDAMMLGLGSVNPSVDASSPSPLSELLVDVLCDLYQGVWTTLVHKDIDRV